MPLSLGSSLYCVVQYWWSCYSSNLKQHWTQRCFNLVLSDICHSLADCGFTHTSQTLLHRPARGSNIVHITCSTVCGCQGTAHPGSCSPIICYMMARHTPHLQCSQPPLKFNNTFKGIHQVFGKSHAWSSSFLHTGNTSESPILLWISSLFTGYQQCSWFCLVCVFEFTCSHCNDYATRDGYC